MFTTLICNMDKLEVSTALKYVKALAEQGFASSTEFDTLYLVWSLLSELEIPASFEAGNDGYTVRLT